MRARHGDHLGGISVQRRDGRAAHSHRYRPARVVADQQHHRHDEPVRHHRRAALTHERRRQAGERQQAGDAADDREHLQREHQRQPGGQQLAEGFGAAEGCPQTTRDDESVHEDHGHEADHAELLADRGGDEVALGQRGQAGPSETPAAPEQAAPGEPELALDDLIVLVVVAERCQPGADPDAHVREPLVGEPPSGREQHPAQQDPARAARRDVHHRDEQPEEQHRGAEVLLVDEDEQAGEPHHEDRPEVARPREGQPEHLRPGHREHILGVGEIAGEREAQHDLGDFGRLEAVAEDPDPDPRAVELHAEGRQRQHQQHETGEEQHVREAAQDPIVLHEQDRGDRAGDAQHHPDELGLRVAAGRLGDEVDPVDHRDAEADQEEGRGEQDRVRVRQPDPHDDMHPDAQGEPGGEDDRPRAGQVPVDVEVGEDVAGEADALRDQEQHQFRGAPAAIDGLLARARAQSGHVSTRRARSGSGRSSAGRSGPARSGPRTRWNRTRSTPG